MARRSAVEAEAEAARSEETAEAAATETVADGRTKAGRSGPEAEAAATGRRRAGARLDGDVATGRRRDDGAGRRGDGGRRWAVVILANENGGREGEPRASFIRGGSLVPGGATTRN